MKKALIIALALILVLSAFVSCDKDDPNNNTDPNVTTDSSLDENTPPEQSTPSEEETLQQLIDNPKTGSLARELVPLELNNEYRFNAGDGGFTYVYKNVELTAYTELREKIEANGFAKYTETEFNSTRTSKYKNYFSTYISNVTQIDLEYHANAKRMYVTATPRVKSALPSREAPEYTAAGAEYPTIMTQFGLEDIDKNNCSMSYIIRIADGSFVIIDSGESLAGVEDRIYSILKKQAPDPNNIVISAWVITHAHSDHHGGFLLFAKKYGKSSDITLKQMVYNFPDNSNLNSVDASSQTLTKNAISNFNGDVEILKPHTGNVLRYADVSFNVLYTQENYLAVSNHFGNYNTSSMVLQMVTKEGTKVIIAADHPVSGSYGGVTWCEGALYNWYGDFIQSYVCTTFHHGLGGGADLKIYDIIQPKVVLWNVEQYRIDLNNMKENSFNKYFTGPAAPSKGIVYYVSSGSSVQIVSFDGGKANVAEYDTIADYLASK